MTPANGGPRTLASCEVDDYVRGIDDIDESANDLGPAKALGQRRDNHRVGRSQCRENRGIFEGSEGHTNISDIIAAVSGSSVVRFHGFALDVGRRIVNRSGRRVHLTRRPLTCARH